MCLLSYVRLDVNNLLSRCSCHVDNFVLILKCLYMMHIMLPFFAFMHLHLASHLCMLDEPCGEPKDVILEPNLKMVFGGPIPKMEGPLECMPRMEDVPRTVQAS